jgi:hypothetical protein
VKVRTEEEMKNFQGLNFLKRILNKCLQNTLRQKVKYKKISRAGCAACGAVHGERKS